VPGTDPLPRSDVPCTFDASSERLRPAVAAGAAALSILAAAPTAGAATDFSWCSATPGLFEGYTVQVEIAPGDTLALLPTTVAASMPPT
jgi:hypothetical protein